MQLLLSCIVKLCFVEMKRVIFTCCLLGQKFSALTVRFHGKELLGALVFEGEILYALWRHWVVIFIVAHECL